MLCNYKKNHELILSFDSLDFGDQLELIFQVDWGRRLKGYRWKRYLKERSWGQVMKESNYASNSLLTQLCE